MGHILYIQFSTVGTMELEGLFVHADIEKLFVHGYTIAMKSPKIIL